MPQTMTKTALIGAAGAIGKSIATALRARQENFRAVGRNREELDKAFQNDPSAEIVTWNPDDPASVRAACRGIDTLIYLVGVPYNKFALHPIIMQKTLDSAIGEGVKHVLLIGTVYPYGMPRTTPVTEQHPRDPQTFKGKMRKAQEDILLKAHAEGKVQGTILRLPDFYGPGVEKSFLHSVFQAAANGGTADMIGPIDLPHEFMYVPDVGPVALALADKPDAYGRWWNFAGAGATTQREIANQIFALAGRKPKLRIIGKTMLRVLGIFNPLLREMVEMHYLITTPLLMDDSALGRLIGGLKKTSYADSIASTFDWYRNNPRTVK